MSINGVVADVATDVALAPAVVGKQHIARSQPFALSKRCRDLELAFEHDEELAARRVVHTDVGFAADEPPHAHRDHRDVGERPHRARVRLPDGELDRREMRLARRVPV